MDFLTSAHHVRVEGDVLAITLVGDLTLLDVQQIAAALDRVIASHGRYAALVNMQGLGTFNADARRYITAWPGNRACYGNAFYGGGITARTLMTLVVRAVQLFTKTNNPVGFFKTEAEARAWLADVGRAEVRIG
jgi:NAD(P)-dependent dehydrogenase (short-subunit alcohol dehydrogenase family)